MIYTLSNRQTKTLNVSRQPLLVYLPCPPDVPDDLVRWAAERLPSVSDLIADAKTETAICRPSEKSHTGAATVFGVLRHEWDDSTPCYCVAVVAVTLRPEKVRGGVVGPQWPNGPVTGADEHPSSSEEPA